MPDVLLVLQNYWNVIDNYGDSLAMGSKQSLGKRFKQKRISQDTQDANGEAEDERALTFEKIALQGMLLYKSCVKMVFNPTQTFKCKQYKGMYVWISTKMW